MTPDRKQKAAFEKLSHLKVGALFMDAGTGKTLPTYRLIESTDYDFCLYLCPFQLIDQVEAEIKRYGGFSKDFLILGIESLSNSDRKYLQAFKAMKRHSRSFIVCDESLKIKNSDAKRTQRIFELSKMAEYKLILNGTPISRNLLDLWSQIHFLSPMILKMDESEFKNTFCEYTVLTKKYRGKTEKREWINRYHNIDYLYSLIEPYIFESQLSLSVGRTDIDVNFSLSKEAEEEYKAIKDHFLNYEEMMKWNNQIFMAMIQKLQMSYCVDEPKFETLGKIIKDNPDDKIIVACKFIKSQQRVKKQFPEVKVISFGKHTYGLNLQDYSIMVLWEKHWDYASLEQIERRIFRKGQKKDCRFFHLNANTGLDKLISENIDKKENLLTKFKEKTNEL